MTISPSDMLLMWFLWVAHFFIVTSCDWRGPGNDSECTSIVNRGIIVWWITDLDDRMKNGDFWIYIGNCGSIYIRQLLSNCGNQVVSILKVFEIRSPYGKGILLVFEACKCFDVLINVMRFPSHLVMVPQ